jgi:type 2 lantibiotic biosynthesis protein LanM
VDAATHERWGHYWRRIAQYDGDAQFEDRARASGLEPTVFLELTQPGTADRPPSSRWLGNRLPRSEIKATRALVGDEYVEERAFLLPLLGALTKVRVALEDASVPPALIAPALQACGDRLFVAASRTLAMKLNLARVQGKLAALTPEERFAEFIHAANLTELCSDSHPMLIRAVDRLCDQAVAMTVELWQRLELNRGELSPNLLEAPNAKLTGAHFALSDPHAGGRTVVRLEFEGDRSLIYKPKPMEPDARFADFVAWLNDRGLRWPLRAAHVLDRGAYGFAEHIAHTPCDSDADVERFFWRQGALVAVFRLLGVVDIHNENIVAHGSHPVPVDLECMLHAASRVPSASVIQRSVTLSDRESVLQSALLPTYFAEGDGYIEVGGLGGRPGQSYPKAHPAWQSIGTDTMHVGEAMRQVPTQENLVTHKGEVVDALGHVDAIVAGFEETYNTLMTNGRDLAHSGGPLAAFADVRVRRLIRPTWHYAAMLRDSTHPDFLRSGPERDLCFERLWRGVTSIGTAVIESERRQLLQGDVPLFRGRAGGRELYDERGELVLDEHIEVSALELARDRVQRMSNDDRTRQSRLVRDSFTVLDANLRGGTSELAPHGSPSTRPPSAGPSPLSTDELVAAAINAGELVLELAHSESGLPVWFSAIPSSADSWRLAPVGIDVYDGQAGVGLFLARAALVGESDRLEESAHAVAGVLVDFVQDYPHGAGVGGYSGWPAVAYALDSIGTDLGEARYANAAGLALGRALDEVEADRTLDVLGGSSGGAIVALGLADAHPEAATLARRCRDRLVEAYADDDSAEWDELLTGLSHGAAGIAWACDRLDEAFDDAAAARLRDRMLAWERERFVAEEGNWPDLRTEAAPTGHGFVTAWCHGAPGIGMARLAMRPDEALEGEIEVALRTTRQRGWQPNDSLCHGALGNAELLILAAEQLERPELLDEARMWAAAVLARRRGGAAWRSGGLPGMEVPGLMMGVAGIGYQLLRLAHPESVASVLTLERQRVPAVRGGRV